MSLKSKIEAVIYASEEPVTLQQLVGLLAEEAGGELEAIASEQALLPLGEEDTHLPTEPASSFEHAASESQPEVVRAEALKTTSSFSLQDGQAGEEFIPQSTSEELDSTATQQGSDADKRRARDRERAVRDHVRRAVDALIRDYANSDRGIEIREVASGFRMGTKPEYHDAVRGFVKSLKPALKLTLPALETLAVVAYKQPVTAAEISEIRGVDSAGVLGGLMARKLIATAGRKQVIGRPMLYKTTRDFLLRFGLKDVQELPSMEEFERMASELVEQEDLPVQHTDTLIEEANVRGDAEHIRESNALGDVPEGAQPETAAPQPNENPSEPEATAESAAGGKHDNPEDPIHHGSTEAAPLYPTEDGQHDSTEAGTSGGEDSSQADQG
ncbi:MAG: SMC-Scp complex subunit ScpB [Janthinobacterium lividum]